MSDRAAYRYYARMSSAVLLKVLLAAGGYFLGTYLDALWGTSPFIMFLCFLTGVSIGLWWVIRNASRP